MRCGPSLQVHVLSYIKGLHGVQFLCLFKYYSQNGCTQSEAKQHCWINVKLPSTQIQIFQAHMYIQSCTCTYTYKCGASQNVHTYYKHVITYGHAMTPLHSHDFPYLKVKQFHSTCKTHQCLKVSQYAGVHVHIINEHTKFIF